MSARRAVIERAREHDRCGDAQRNDEHPTLEANVGRVVRVKDAPSRDGGLPLRHGASRHADAGSSTPLVLFFFSVPRDTKKAIIQFRGD